jgi:hypothetical protein
MTKTDLQLHIQKWYPRYLRSMLVDIVETDRKGAVFGFPTGGGNTGYVRFIPYANGQVGVQEGNYYERGNVTEWYDIEKWPDVDCYLQLEVGATPEETPATPLTNYRRY